MYLFFDVILYLRVSILWFMHIPYCILLNKWLEIATMSKELDRLISKRSNWSLDQYSLHADSLDESFTMLLTFVDWLEPVKVGGWSWYEEIKNRYPCLRSCSKSRVRRVYALL